MVDLFLVLCMTVQSPWRSEVRIKLGHVSTLQSWLSACRWQHLDIIDVSSCWSHSAHVS